jgi:two-component system LytT family response regulator
MRALVVDDDSVERAALARLCEARSEFADLRTAESGSEALQVIRANRPELVLLGCELNDMTGFDVLRSLSKTDRPAAIMVAADERHAVEAAELAAIDYLTKPVCVERFEAALLRVNMHIRQVTGDVRGAKLPSDARSAANCSDESLLGFADRLVGERAGRFYFVTPDTVDYIESDSNYVKIHVANDRYITRDSIKRLAPLLGKRGFVRISRSILVNLKRVEFAERDGFGVMAFVLGSGVRLLSSAGYRLGSGAELKVERTRGVRRFASEV